MTPMKDDLIRLAEAWVEAATAAAHDYPDHRVPRWMLPEAKSFRAYVDTLEAPADVREVAQELVHQWRKAAENHTESVFDWCCGDGHKALEQAIASALTAQRAAGVEAERERWRACAHLCDGTPRSWDIAALDRMWAIRPDDGEGTK